MNGIFKCLYVLGFIHLYEVLSAIKVDCFTGTMYAKRASFVNVEHILLIHPLLYITGIF